MDDSVDKQSARNRLKKVLIVEDNELNLKLFKDLIISQGCIAIDTQNGMEAFSLVKEHKPNLILMDIQLHGISGFDIIKRIKLEDSIKDIPIIAVTAFAMKDDKEKILQSGCEDYISKPIMIAPFIKLINRFLNKN